MARNRAFCQRPQCAVWQAVSDDAVPPYWRKVLMVRDALRSGLPDGTLCTTILWMDRDAVITGAGPDLTLRGHDMRISHDGVRRMCLHDRSPSDRWRCLHFNAGAFLVRSSSTGLAILDAWAAFWETYASRHWRRSLQGKWYCVAPCVEDARCAAATAPCHWAGQSYEQGAFYRSVLPNFTKVRDWVGVDLNCRILTRVPCFIRRCSSTQR